MRSIALILVLVIYLPLPVPGQRLLLRRKLHSDDDDDHIEDDDDDLDSNSTGTYVGDACEDECNPRLMHVVCNHKSGLCECDKKYPVRLNPYTGCSKPKRLGEQCYYRETCFYTDQHSSCIQVHHNAVCQCKSGFHSVSIQKPSKRTFCAEDLQVMTTDFSTLAGVISGIAVLSGLICFVLKLFNQTLYTGRPRYGNANLAPPILFSSDAGPLTMPIIERSMASRASSQRTLASLQSRRVSSAQGCRGISVSASRAGSRRPSITSIHSGSSVRSYSTRRYEKERQQKEEREMQKRLSRAPSSTITTNTNGGRYPPTPSPHSTEELLPTLEENQVQQVPLAIQEESSSSFQDELPSTSKQFP